MAKLEILSLFENERKEKKVQTGYKNTTLSRLIANLIYPPNYGRKVELRVSECRYFVEEMLEVDKLVMSNSENHCQLTIIRDG